MAGSGQPFFIRAVQSVIHCSPNMWTLIRLGTSAAFLYSVVAMLAPDVFPTSFAVHGDVAIYFEAAAVILSLTLLGQMLELKARSKTSAAIKSLLGLAPKTARRVNADGTENRTDPDGADNELFHRRREGKLALDERDRAGNDAGVVAEGQAAESRDGDGDVDERLMPPRDRWLTRPVSPLRWHAPLLLRLRETSDHSHCCLAFDSARTSPFRRRCQIHAAHVLATRDPRADG